MFNQYNTIQHNIQKTYNFIYLHVLKYIRLGRTSTWKCLLFHSSKEKLRFIGIPLNIELIHSLYVQQHNGNGEQNR